MINPLLPDLSSLSDAELELKIRDLNKKYYTISRMGNRSMAMQVFGLMDDYMGEQKRRQDIQLKKMKDENPDDINGLINIG